MFAQLWHHAHKLIDELKNMMNDFQHNTNIQIYYFGKHFLHIDQLVICTMLQYVVFSPRITTQKSNYIRQRL